MPKITECNVAAHRQKRYKELLAAAKELLITNGIAATTPAAVGKKIGLARSSVYEYFSNSHQILVAILLESATELNSEIVDALQDISDPDQVIEVYVQIICGYASRGLHQVISALPIDKIPPQCNREVSDIHRRIAQPLSAALDEKNVDIIDRNFVHGVLSTAIKGIENNDIPAEIAANRAIFLIQSLLSRAT